MNNKQILHVIIGLALVAIVVSLSPLWPFYSNFKNAPLSIDGGDWGVFGDYIGGTTGTFLTFFAVIFSLTSLYFTARISRQIQENEFVFLNQQNENHRELLHLQNKPFPNFYLSRTKVKEHHELEIRIQNMGLGPMIITEWHLSYNQSTYKDFGRLFSNELLSSSTVGVAFDSEEQFTIAPNGEQILFRLTLSGMLNERESLFHKTCETLKNVTIQVSYEDIFQNKFDFKKRLSYFGIHFDIIP